jgi:hypothetical protein
MIVARQSTARTVTVGPVLDADGVAVTDGVVGDFKISKNGGAPAALNGSATLTHRNTGHYSLALTASDLDTVGTAEVVIDDTVNACPMKELTVIEEAVYDALYAASAVGPLLANSDGSGLTEAGGTGDHLTALATQASVNTIDDFLDTEIAALTTELAKVPKSDGTATWNATALASIQSEANDALVAYDPPTNAELVSEINAVQSDIAALNNLSAAQVNAEVDTALSDYGPIRVLRKGTAQAGGGASITLDAGASATNNLYRYNAITIVSGTGAGQSGYIHAYDGSTKVASVEPGWATNPSSDSVFEIIGTAIADIHAINGNSTYDQYLGTLVNDYNNGSLSAGVPLTAAAYAGVADSVWDEAQSGHTTAGTFGKYLDDEVSQVGGGSAPTAAEVADAVWDEAIAGHLTAGSTGNKLNAAASAGDPWSTALPGSYGVGEAGYILDAIKDVTDAINTSNVEVVSALDGSTLTVYVGTEMSAANGNSQAFNYTTLPDLTSGAARVRIRTTAADAVIEKALTITNAGAATQTITLVLTAAETALLVAPTNYIYSIEYKTSGATSYSVATQGSLIAKRQ